MCGICSTIWLLCDPLFLSTDAILAKIHEAGFQVAMEKELSLTKEQAMQFYKEHEGKDFFDSLTTHMSRCVYHKHSMNMFNDAALSVQWSHAGLVSGQRGSCVRMEKATGSKDCGGC